MPGRFRQTEAESVTLPRRMDQAYPSLFEQCDGLGEKNTGQFVIIIHPVFISIISEREAYEA